MTSGRSTRSTRLPRGTSRSRLQGFVRAGGTFSGGTYHSAVDIMGRLRQGAASRRERRRLEPRPPGRRVTGVPSRPRRRARAAAGSSPAPTIDPLSRAALGAGAGALRPRLHATRTTSWSSGCRCWRCWSPAPAADRAGAAAANPGAAAEVWSPGRRPQRRAARAVVVQRPVRGRGRRPARDRRGQRRRPGLRRDLEDAGRVGAVPGPRRAAGDRRPGDPRGRDGAGADRTG